MVLWGGSGAAGSADSAELVLNVVSAITNLSFYEVEDNAVLGLRASTPRFLTPLLLSDNPEAQVEAARAFGNFSRHPEVRAQRADSGGAGPGHQTIETYARGPPVFQGMDSVPPATGVYCVYF